MAKVLFKRKTTNEINELEVEDGALIYNTDNGKTYMDFGETRIQTGGNADTMIAIGGEEPTDTDIKLWFPDDTINTKASEVVNSMDGNEIDKSPSVNAVKNYINGDILYSNPTGNRAEITLLKSVSNYKRIKVFYFNGDINNSVEIDLSSNKTDFLMTSEYKSGTTMAHTFARYKINNMALTPILDECGYYTLSSQGTVLHYDNTNYSSIYKVIGYKEVSE